MIYSLEQDRILCQIAKPESETRFLTTAISPDNKTLYAAGSNAGIYIINIIKANI